MARAAALQPVGLKPDSRIRRTVAFKASCVGFSGGSHLKAWRYQRMVFAETFKRYCRCLINCSKRVTILKAQACDFFRGFMS